MDKRPEPAYLVGDYTDCLAYAEACGLEGGEWWYIDSKEKLEEIPSEADIVIVCTESKYWRMDGYWQEPEFMDVFWKKNLWYRWVPVSEA